MSSIQIPNREKIREAYQQGAAAVISLFEETFLALAERVQKLEDQLAKNSRNSGKPPSSDGYDQPVQRTKVYESAQGAKAADSPDIAARP